MAFCTLQINQVSVPGCHAEWEFLGLMSHFISTEHYFPHIDFQVTIQSPALIFPLQNPQFNCRDILPQLRKFTNHLRQKNWEMIRVDIKPEGNFIGQLSYYVEDGNSFRNGYRSLSEKILRYQKSPVGDSNSIWILEEDFLFFSIYKSPGVWTIPLDDQENIMQLVSNCLNLFLRNSSRDQSELLQDTNHYLRLKISDNNEWTLSASIRTTAESKHKGKLLHCPDLYIPIKVTIGGKGFFLMVLIAEWKSGEVTYFQHLKW